jgi:environmental stress-induced protein Ves
MRVLEAKDYRSMPWKNGGGVTTEIAVYPQGAGLDAFDWRISTARVDSDGPFSTFPGIDRTLAVLSGKGLRLTVAGRAGVELLPTSEPWSFPGDVAASGTRVGGPVVDLNVMTRRDRHCHRVSRLEIDGERTIPFRASIAFLFSPNHDLDVRLGQESTSLVAGDTLLVEREAGALLVQGDARTSVFLIEISAVAGNRRSPSP